MSAETIWLLVAASTINRPAFLAAVASIRHGYSSPSTTEMA
jgi:hypothetical protein